MLVACPYSWSTFLFGLVGWCLLLLLYMMGWAVSRGWVSLLGYKVFGFGVDFVVETVYDGN